MLLALIPPGSEAESALRLLCLQRVQAAGLDISAGEGEPADLVERLARIVHQNLAAGRVQRVLAARLPAPPDENADLTDASTTNDLDAASDPLADLYPQFSPYLAWYIDRVIYYYRQESPRVACLVARDPTSWGELLDALVQRAHAILIQFNVPRQRVAADAEEFAQETCETVYTHRFPYDVDFDAWVGLILRNKIRQRHRSADLASQLGKLVSLDQSSERETDALPPWHELVADDDDSVFERYAVRERVLQAVEHLLSPGQQQVILWGFIYGLSDAQIAQQMGRTVNAVQVLRHRALKRLKEVLTQ